MAIGAGFALYFIPNVELISLIVFLAGISLGTRWGILVGCMSEFIFSALNPLGSGLVFPPLLLSQVLAFGLIGAAGGLFRKSFLYRSLTARYWITAGLAGLILSFIYDTLTSLSYPVAAGFGFRETLGIYLTGLGFTVMHLVSNTLVFAFGVPLVVNQLQDSFE